MVCEGVLTTCCGRSDPTHAPAVRIPVSLEGCTSAIMPEISLAARAGSLGATSLQSAQRNSGTFFLLVGGVQVPDPVHGGRC